MTTLDVFALILEIEQAGAYANIMYYSQTHSLSVHITFPKGHKYEKEDRFYSISVDKEEDVKVKCDNLRKIKEALK